MDLNGVIDIFNEVASDAVLNDDHYFLTFEEMLQVAENEIDDM